MEKSKTDLLPISSSTCASVWRGSLSLQRMDSYIRLSFWFFIFPGGQRYSINFKLFCRGVPFPFEPMPPATKCFLVFLRSKELLFIFDCHTCFCVCQDANIISIESRLPSSFFLGCSVFFLERKPTSSVQSTLVSRFPPGCLFPDYSDSCVPSGNKHGNRIFLTPISSFTATSPIDSTSFSIFIKADSIIYLDVSLK